MTRSQIASMLAGVAVAVFGVVLLLDQDGTIAIEGGWLAAALTACAGASLVASGFGARDD